ncbi:MAG: alpha/beta hydrolase-fold protein [Bacteroidota bacterium]|nr:alpha/beta hydrolase-fold protein [Bacteroidota bacterium]
MKRSLFSVLFIALFCSSNGQNDNKIVIGKIDSIQSRILNEERKIMVYIPDGFSAADFARQRYPVVYLLDGEAHFISVVGMIQQLSEVNNNMVCPKMIVVGIPNIDRTKDLTPTHADAGPPYFYGSSKTSGGGENFISFIEKELMPYIDAHYPTAPYKMLIGHSFGGLTVMQTLVHHTGLFNAYVSIDPSMWWDNQHLLKEAKKAIAEKKFQGTYLFLGIANTMDDGINLKKVLNDTSSITRHIRSLLALKRYFEINKQNGLKYMVKYYDNDSHASVPLITEYDALHFIFNYYPIKIGFKDFSDTSTALPDKCERHFSNVSKQMGYKVTAPEQLMNHQGYDALNSKKFKKAERFFKYNIDNYPGSFNAYDSMGDYYQAIGDKLNAISNFQKALSIKEDADTRKKLKELQGG